MRTLPGVGLGGSGVEGWLRVVRSGFKTPELPPFPRSPRVTIAAAIAMAPLWLPPPQLTRTGVHLGHPPPARGWTVPPRSTHAWESAWPPSQHGDDRVTASQHCGGGDAVRDPAPSPARGGLEEMPTWQATTLAPAGAAWRGQARSRPTRTLSDRFWAFPRRHVPPPRRCGGKRKNRLPLLLVINGMIAVS